MKQKITIFLSVLLLFSSCEKIVNVPLDDADERIVVEAVLKDAVDSSFVTLSKSTTVYGDPNFQRIEDASVVVKDNTGESYTFEHDSNGKYLMKDFLVIPGRTYSLEVNTGDEIITANSEAKSKPIIDSLSYFPITGAFGLPEGDTIYLVSFHSTDDIDQQNFYLAKIFRNGIENGGYYLGNDDFINGQSFEAQFFGAEADPGASIVVEFISMDEPNYDYFIGLQDNLDTSPFSAAPANPPSNLQSASGTEVLGYFGAYTTAVSSIEIP